MNPCIQSYINKKSVNRLIITDLRFVFPLDVTTDGDLFNRTFLTLDWPKIQEGNQSRQIALEKVDEKDFKATRILSGESSDLYFPVIDLGQALRGSVHEIIQTLKTFKPFSKALRKILKLSLEQVDKEQRSKLFSSYLKILRALSDDHDIIPEVSGLGELTLGSRDVVSILTCWPKETPFSFEGYLIKAGFQIRGEDPDKGFEGEIFDLDSNRQQKGKPFKIKGEIKGATFDQVVVNESNSLDFLKQNTIRYLVYQADEMTPDFIRHVGSLAVSQEDFTYTPAKLKIDALNYSTEKDEKGRSKKEPCDHLNDEQRIALLKRSKGVRNFAYSNRVQVEYVLMEKKVPVTAWDP